MLRNLYRWNANKISFRGQKSFAFAFNFKKSFPQMIIFFYSKGNLPNNLLTRDSQCELFFIIIFFALFVTMDQIVLIA